MSPIPDEVLRQVTERRESVPVAWPDVERPVGGLIRDVDTATVLRVADLARELTQAREAIRRLTDDSAGEVIATGGGLYCRWCHMVFSVRESLAEVHARFSAHPCCRKLARACLPENSK